MSTAFALSSAATGSISAINHLRNAKSPSTSMKMMLKSSICFQSSRNGIASARLEQIGCHVALKSTASVESGSLPSDSSSTEGEETEVEEKSKEGARIRVKVPLKVYHVNRLPEVDLNGKEGTIKQYVGIWKGKSISSNLPYKVEFFIDVPDRGSVKFFAHLKEDEFEFIDD